MFVKNGLITIGGYNDDDNDKDISLAETVQDIMKEAKLGDKH